MFFIGTFRSFTNPRLPRKLAASAFKLARSSSIFDCLDAEPFEPSNPNGPWVPVGSAALGASETRTFLARRVEIQTTFC